MTGSGTEADRKIRGLENRMYHNDEAVANCHGFVDGEEVYEDYHMEATDEYAEAAAYQRRMAAEHGASPPAAPADGRVGESVSRAESGCRGLPRSGNHVNAPVPGDADRPVAEPVESRVGAR